MALGGLPSGNHLARLRVADRSFDGASFRNLTVRFADYSGCGAFCGVTSTEPRSLTRDSLIAIFGKPTSPTPNSPTAYLWTATSTMQCSYEPVFRTRNFRIAA